MEEIDDKKLSAEKVFIVRDVYGTLVSSNGELTKVYRYTWYSHNRIQVQVITYGARIISMKSPCRNGVMEDIVMGFDKLSDFVHRDLNMFGATIGRCAGFVENGTYAMNGNQYFLQKNYNEKHHLNGGRNGFHRRLFTPYVDGKKLILSYISEDGEEGYPGALLLRITYELSTKNEFRVNMEAFATQETIINLTNCLYFNLGGHRAGLNSMRRHYITINANCFLVKRNDGFPTGEIRSVINTDLDYQIPKLTDKLSQREKFNECLCVNRGVDQIDCFVASLFHPPSGRLLEIYSNQPGVNVSLPSNFGVGDITDDATALKKRVDEIFDILKVVRVRAEQLFENNDPGDLSIVRDLTRKLGRRIRGKTNLNLNEKQVQELVETKDAVVRVRYRSSVFGEIAKLIDNILPSAGDEEASQEELESTEPKPIINCSDDKRFIGKNGAVYVNNGAVCIQTLNYSNAVYHKNFPNCVLKPGEIYRHTIVYKFWVRAGSPAKWMRRMNREFRGKDDD